MKPQSNQKRKEVAQVFFRMGWYAFGGPAAHIAMMEQEIVTKRQWMTRDHFLDLVGATNLIPGPNSTEMTMHCGHERAGVPGLFIAGICFIFPSALLTGLLAWFYVSFGDLPAIEPFFRGIKPAVLAIIAGAILKLGKNALKNVELGVLGSLTLAASLLGASEIVALLVSGFLGGLYFYARRRTAASILILPGLLLWQNASEAFAKMETTQIFWSFLKVGAILYGSGYVLFAYLEAELVDPGWLARSALMDAIAIGQFTPGPVLSTATFIGYQMGGLEGAIAATLGIFLPSFVFVWILNPLIPKLRQSLFFSSFLDAVNVAAVAVMVSVLWVMGRESVSDWSNAIIALLGALAVFGPRKIGPMWIVLGGSLLGALFGYIGG